MSGREEKNRPKKSYVESLAARLHWSLGVVTAAGDTVIPTKELLKLWGVGQESTGTGATTWAGR